MLKALLKKQLLEMSTFYLQDRKTGKRRSKKSAAAYIILFIFIFVSAASAFAGTAYMLSSTLLGTKQEWLYYSTMFTMATGFGVFGSVFNTYTSIFHAKDNELLLAMPIPPSKILFVRMSGIFLWSMFFESLILVPTLIMCFITGSPAFLTVALFILLALFNGMLITTVSCLLGWLVALIAGKIKNKSIITVFISLAFLGVYFFVCSKINSLLTLFTTDSEIIGGKIKTFAYPIYALGKAASGHIPSFFLYAALCSALFALTYFFISRSIIRIMSSENHGEKAEYKEKPVKTKSLSSALLRKELVHLKSSSVYMLNCCLGVIMMPVLSVLSLVYAGKMREFIPEIFGDYERLVPLLAAALLCLAVSMNDITAPSISLEGKNLWILHSMPVSAEKVFEAKIRLHMILTLPLALILGLCFSTSLKLEMTTVIYILVLIYGFVYLDASLGIVINLKIPNLTWKDESVPVKQGFSVLIMLFFGFIVAFCLAVFGYFAEKLISVDNCILVFAIILILLARFTNMWLNKNGKEIFDSL